MKMRGWMYGVALAAFCFAACDDDDNENERMDLEETDDMFVEKTALSNLTEVQFGTLAANEGTDSLVRAYGQMMQTEHTTAQQELQTLANDFNNVEWPEDMDAAHEQLYQQLSTMEGHAFDSMYIATQVNDHTMTLQVFETEISDGENQRVTSYANKYRPHIEHHLELADSIKAVVIDQDDGEDDEGN
jgi:putative membrane protein